MGVPCGASLASSLHDFDMSLVHTAPALLGPSTYMKPQKYISYMHLHFIFLFFSRSIFSTSRKKIKNIKVGDKRFS